MFSNNSRRIKIICIICFIMTIVALNVAKNSPAIAYEPSIYVATPLVIWFVLFVNLVCGIAIIISKLRANKHKEDHLWLLGILLILINYIIILSLWIIRGYALWCIGDPAVHLGLMRDILYTGYIDSRRPNLYPVIHIFAANISIICSISITIVHKYLPLILSILYLFFMYLVAKSVLPENEQVIIALIVSTVFGAGIFLNCTPNMSASLVFPLAVFLLVKNLDSNEIAWKILFLTIIFLYPVFHPVPAYAIFVILTIVWVVNVIRNLANSDSLVGRSINQNFVNTTALILFIWGISWFSEFWVWSYTIQNIKNSIIEGGNTYFADTMAAALYATGYGYNILDYFLKIYLIFIIYIVISIISFLVLIWRYRSHLSQLFSANLFILYIPSLIFLISIFATLFTKVPFGPERFLPFIVILTIPLVAFGLYELLRNHHFFLSNIVVAIILIALLIHGYSIVYPSPYIYNDNWQITRTELAGMDWLLHKEEATIGIAGIRIMPGQFAQFLLTPNELKAAGPNILTDRGAVKQELRPPWHFGYDSGSTLGRWYKEDTYLVLTSRDKSHYVDIYPSMAAIRFMLIDYERLKKDTSIDFIYANNGLNIYMIKSISGQALA